MGRNHQNFLRLLSLPALLTALSIWAYTAPTPKKVLLFSSEDFRLPASVTLVEAIRSTLDADTSIEVSFYNESLDNARIPNEKYEAEYVSFLRKKYEDEKIDLISVRGAGAMRFLRKYEKDIFIGVPKIFSVTDQRQVGDLSLGPDVTAVYGKIEFTGTLRVILAQWPSTKRIVVITGSSTQDKSYQEQARAEFAGYAGQVDFNYLSGLSTEDLRAELSPLPPDSVCIFISYFRGPDGRVYTMPTAISEVMASVKVPMYAIAETAMGSGVVGGDMLSFQATGERIAEVGKRILAGEKPSNIPATTMMSVPMFDWRQLRRWNISEQSLPAGSIVRFKEPTFWEQYKWQASGTIAFIFLETALIAWLLLLRARRKQAVMESLRLAALAASQHDRLDAVVGNVPGIVWESKIDPATGQRRARFVSAYVEEMLGYSVEECLSDPEFISSRVIEEDRESFKGDADKAFQTGEPMVTQFRCERNDGVHIWAESYMVGVRDESGEPVGLRGVTMDITDRKTAEENVRRSEALFRNLADTAPVIIWMSDVEPLITFVNKLGVEYTGLSEESLFGTGWLNVVHEEDRQHTTEVYNHGYALKQPWVQEYRLLGADGTYRWFYATSAPRFGSHGEFLGYIGSCIDISDRKASEESLQTAMIEIRKLKDSLQEENVYLKEMIKLDHDFEEIIGKSDELKYILFKIEQVAPTDATVLISGETGTGKELVARALHKMSPRKSRPLIKVNCAALSASLIESELFGHERGSFTGATTRKIGRFELADGGTLFLDEIGELPLELQPKLLRLIQEGEFERLGSSKTIRADVRIIAATNRELHNEVKNGRFREDLMYRLNVFPITVPPLRQRTEDIPLLVEYFTNSLSKKMGKTITSISPTVMRSLAEYHWPGNIRELANVIERAVIGSNDEKLRLIEGFEAKNSSQESEGPVETLESMERSHILKALTATSWRIEGGNGAARALGINASTLRSRMNKLGLSKTSRAVH